MRYLLDTNTCIAAMRHQAMVMRHMSAVAPADCAASTVTSYELLTGVEKCASPAVELAKVKRLLSVVGEIDFDASAAREAAQIRALLESQGRMIGPYDVLLAGHAQSLGLTLVTANTSEFSRVPGLQLENWLS
jgi:tRNA(fMet)-specific endonuclease VapC